MTTHRIGFEVATFSSTNAGQTVTRTLHDDDYTAYGSTLAPVWLVEAGDILVLAGAAGRAKSGAGGSTQVGAYVTDATGLTQGALVTSGITVSTMDSVENIMRDSAPLSFDLTAWAGQWIKPATADDVNFRRGFYNVGTVSGDTVLGGNSFPDPFGSATNQSQIFGMHITIERPSGFGITSVNDDDELYSGAVNTAEVVGYDAGTNPIVSGTVGSLAVTDVSQTGTEAEFTIPAPTDAAYWPEPDTTQTLTLTDGADPATFDALFNSIPGYTSVVIASPDNDDQYKLGYWATFPLEDGDRVMFDPPNPAPPDSTTGWTVNADGSYQDAPDGVKVWYHWRTATSLMYIYEATVGGGVVVDNRGLSVVGLSVTGLSVAGLSVAGL